MQYAISEDSDSFISGNQTNALIDEAGCRSRDHITHVQRMTFEPAGRFYQVSDVKGRTHFARLMA